MKSNKERLAKKLCLAFGAFLLVALGALHTVAQKDQGVNDAILADVMKTKGKVLAEGRNLQPIGQFNLRSYRLEEIPLKQSVTVEIDGKPLVTDKAWRLIVTGGPFPVRALPPVVWIDDVQIGYGVENERLSEISVLTFDRSLLREGATIAVSYGESKRDRVALPEKLSLTAGGKGGLQ